MRCRLRLFSNIFTSQPNYTWQLPVPVGGTALLQTSTNLLDWVSVIAVTNTGGIVEWLDEGAVSSRFFRAIRR